MYDDRLINMRSDVAMTHFRDAIRIDSRHYNAWYGLGTVYYRQVSNSSAMIDGDEEHH